MRFPDSFLDDIRDRLRISEVIGQRVQFDKKKTNAQKGDFWGCCPFHGEKTPSFHCEDRKGRYYCFGCGESGDHFRFLTELDGISFHEAVERLAAQAGLPMPVLDKRQAEQEEKRKTLFDVMELAAQFFRMQLHEPAGAHARSYLRDRGLSSSIQEEFTIGWAPDSRNALKQFLAEKGVEPQQMEACGLISSKEGAALSYDRFRGRVMFPIPDSRGRVIAFGGRALNPDALAKYLNSPETELFHKSNVLYNYAKARKSVYDRKQVIVAEGYMDVIALHSAGFEYSVAPLGTALTERQMELLWRMNPEPTLCFDGDGAGLRAAHRVMDMVLPHIQPGRSVRFAMLPEGKDPDDLIRDEGREAMQGVIDNALPLSDMIWNREISSGVFDTPERRAELQSRMRSLVNTIREESVRYHYDQEIKNRLTSYFTKETPVGDKFGDRKGKSGWNNFSQNRQGRDNNKAGSGRKFSASPSLLGSRLVKRGHVGMPLREAALIGGLVFHPALGVRFFEEASSLMLQNKDAKIAQSIFLDCFASWDGEEEMPTREFVEQHFQQNGLSDLFAHLKHLLVTNHLWQMLPEASYEDAKDGWHQAYLLHLKNQTLNSELKAAERALAEEDSQENLDRLLQIQRELTRSDGIEALIDGFGSSSGRPRRDF